MKKKLLFFFLLTAFFNQLIAQAPLWEEQNDFINGYARVFHIDKFSFINEEQKLISPFVFEDARNFYTGLAAVKQHDKWGFINTKGILVIPCEYDIVFDFRERVSVVFKNGNWWLLDASAKLGKKLDISVCYGFKNGKASIDKDGRKGSMDLAGNIVFEKINPTLLRPIIPYINGISTASCPDNLDFNFGNFTNWKCFIGRVDSVGNTNVITVNPSPATPGRHTIIPRVIPSAIDPFGLFPTNPPDGSAFACKLGNTQTGAQAERIRYTIHVPTNDSNFSFRYSYAVVFQDPGHTSWTQPRFTVKVLDSATNSYINCASFEYISTSGLPGFTRSTVDTSVIFKPWSPVYISLRGHAGRTVYLEFTTADCVRRAHWGYAYMDVEDLCDNPIQMNYQCDSPHTATLTGPPGFQFYNWWDSSFTTIVGTGQQLILNPGPPPNTLLWLELIPYNGYGCVDTIPIRLRGSTTVHFETSDTLGICAPHSFTFYNHILPSISANWNFGDGTTGTGDTVTHVYNLPGTYIVRLTVTDASSCTGVAVDTIRVIQPSGTFTYAGGNFCNNQTVQFTANTNYIDSLFWDFGDGSFLNTTLNTVSHTYAQPGIYLPHLIIKSNYGCQFLLPGIDTIKIEKLLPGFLNNLQQFCTYTTVSFSDTSHSFFGIGTRVWDFGDGTTGAGINVSHTYTSTGTYIIKLVITGITGCKDSVVHSVYIKVNNNPVASITGINAACVNTSVIFTGSAVSVDPVGLYSWTCSNGAVGTGTTFSTSFNTAGNYTITLITTTIYGCSDTIVHPITINPLPTASIVGANAVCLNAPSPNITFTGAGGTAPYTFTYNINGGANQTISTISGNSVTIAAPTNVAGTFVYNLISIQESSSTNCFQLQSGNVIITVNPLPTANIAGANAVCLNAPSPNITFTGAGGTAPYTFTYNINGGANQTITTTSGNSVTLAAPTNVAGTFTYTLISVQDASSTACSQLQSGNVIITVNPLPTANIAGANAVCLNAPSPIITFTGAGGTAQYTFTYNINGGANQTITTTSGNSVTIAAPTNVAGTFTYTLIGVQDASSTTCSQLQSGNVIITVNPLPTANIAGANAVCLNAPSPNITFTGAGGTAPYTFTYNINGGANQTITTTSGNSVTIAAQTNVAGTFTYTLISVQDASSTACSQLQSGNVIITVNPLPTASIAGANAVCLNAPSPLVSFTGAGGTAPYTFAYTINGGPVQTISTTTGNSVSITVPTNTVGVFNYVLQGVHDGSATSCTQLQSGNVSIRVNPLPTASISGPVTVCLGGPSPTVTFTGANGTPPYTFTYNINGGASQIINTTTGNSVSISVPDNIAGLFNYLMVSVKDASITACSNPQSASALITIHPIPIVSAGSDRNLCKGSSVQLNATGAAQYSWTPATGLSCTNCPNPVANPIDTIQYIVQGTSAFGCVAQDTIKLTLIKPFPMQASPSDTICQGNFIVLNASGADHYIWTPPVGLTRSDIASPRAAPTTTTTYQVVGYDGFNCFSDTAYIKITVGPKPTVDAGADLNLATGDIVTLHPITTNGPITQWLWEPSAGLSCNTCPNPVLTIHDNTSYWVTVTNQFNCVAKDAINIVTFCKSAQVFIPNAFTPDGDGLNDVLMVRGKGVRVNYFRIFNRWGELVFEKKDFDPNDPRYGWDGRVRGIPASPDVFVYTAEVMCDNNVVHVFKGNTTILK